MMVEIPHVLDTAGLARVRGLIDAAEWIDGNATSGHQSALAKRNMQLPEDSAAARQAGEVIVNAMAATPLFIAAALTLKRADDGGEGNDGVGQVRSPVWPTDYKNEQLKAAAIT